MKQAKNHDRPSHSPVKFAVDVDYSLSTLYLAVRAAQLAALGEL